MKHLGVHGRDVEMTEAVREYGGHPLALRLLGNYLSMGYDGDIRKRDTIKELIEETGYFRKKKGLNVGGVEGEKEKSL